MKREKGVGAMSILDGRAGRMSLKKVFLLFKCIFLHIRLAFNFFQMSANAGNGTFDPFSGTGYLTLVNPPLLTQNRGIYARPVKSLQKRRFNGARISSAF